MDLVIRIFSTQEKVITCSTFKFLGSYTPYGDFLDGHDGYWYGFANQANSSGDAKMYWVKIKKDDYTMTEGIWTEEVRDFGIRVYGAVYSGEWLWKIRTGSGGE